MFSIRIIDDRGPEGQLLGEITMGKFTERFECNVPLSASSEWNAKLKELFNGGTVVALIHDPRFAWIFYREGDRCFVQQRLALNGQFDNLPPRRTGTEDGGKVSEWIVSINDVRSFLLGGDLDIKP